MPLKKNQYISFPGIRALFCCLWVFMFALYFPAAKAGFVSDFTGWLDQVQNRPFLEYINRANFKVVSLYQFTQFVTWCFYQVLGINPWRWHLLFITLHVSNACLLYRICGGMLKDAGAANYRTMGYMGAFLFCATPYISEVVVWEASFHYLQGLLLLLLILAWVQRYIYTAQRRYIFLVCFVYALSTHSLEVFYTTPWLALSLALFYHFVSTEGKERFKKVLLYFVLPMFVIFVLRLLEYRLLYGDWVSRVGFAGAMTITETGLGKPAKYLFHLLLLGRYLPDQWHLGQMNMADIKARIYAFCDATTGIALFYCLCGIVFTWCIIRFRKMAGVGKVGAVLFLWVFIMLVLITPLWFADDMLLVFDRYAYFASAFLFVLVAIALASIPNKYIRITLFAIVVLANLRYAIQVNRYWGKSTNIISSLLHNLPPENGKAIVLLNMPECMHGVPMLGAWPESEYKLMHNLLLPGKPLTVTVHEALAYNMLTPDDGANVTVLNDTTLRVTLNQWGTWWWYEGKGGRSYENEAYRLNMIDGGHFYEITFRQSLQQFLLLYQVGAVWKVVDIDKRNEEQH